MPDSRTQSLFRWGEALRRRRAARRTARIRAAATIMASAAVAALLASLACPPRPQLLWNVTASSPVGLYRIAPSGRVQRGDMVVAWPPEPARELGARRRYLPRNVPLIKRVAAVAGDRVCAAGEALYVNGRLEARRHAQDALGRAMPWWRGCHALVGGELLLLSPGVPHAFDGRYFGLTSQHQVLGKARLLWRG
jgi:conjugative transfer signal peptidase TraF